MTTPLSDEEFAAFLQEAGIENPPPIEEDKERSLEELLSEIQNVIPSDDLDEPLLSPLPEAPPLQTEPSPRPHILSKIVTIFVAISLCISLGLSCYLTFALNREIFALKELQVEMEKLIEKVPSSFPLPDEISEEKLLEELNPSFPEEEIIEPIDLFQDFSVA